MGTALCCVWDEHCSNRVDDFLPFQSVRNYIYSSQTPAEVKISEILFQYPRHDKQNNALHLLYNILKSIIPHQ